MNTDQLNTTNVPAQPCPTCGRCPTCGAYKPPVIINWPALNPVNPITTTSGIVGINELKT